MRPDRFDDKIERLRGLLTDPALCDRGKGHIAEETGLKARLRGSGAC